MSFKNIKIYKIEFISDLMSNLLDIGCFIVQSPKNKEIIKFWFFCLKYLKTPIWGG